jgi:hypothetical protein
MSTIAVCPPLLYVHHCCMSIIAVCPSLLYVHHCCMSIIAVCPSLLYAADKLGVGDLDEAQIARLTRYVDSMLHTLEEIQEQEEPEQESPGSLASLLMPAAGEYRRCVLSAPALKCAWPELLECC